MILETIARLGQELDFPDFNFSSSSIQLITFDEDIDVGFAHDKENDLLLISTAILEIPKHTDTVRQLLLEALFENRAPNTGVFAYDDHTSSLVYVIRMTSEHLCAGKSSATTDLLVDRINHVLKINRKWRRRGRNLLQLDGYSA